MTTRATSSSRRRRAPSRTSTTRGAPAPTFTAAASTRSERFEETWTKNETGTTFEVEGRGVFEELTAELVRNDQVPEDLIPDEGLTGPVYRFTARDKGRPVVEDSRGRVLAEDRGLAVFRALFDTLGDFKPGGTFLMDEIVRVEGPHPVLLGEVDLCDLATTLPAPGDDDDHDDD